MKAKLLLTLFLSFSLSVFSQDHKEKRDQIKALKVSFLTTELNLTSDESAKFWPVYNNYEEKEYQIRHDKMRSIIKKIDQAGNTLTEKDANAYLTQLQEAEEELLALRKKMVTELKPIIGAVKVIKMQKAEFDFKRKLLSKYRDKKK
ncbi:sensor of ECF-type sigma factor [Flavobacterium alkalisoli]|uniref:Sensor of ECF-type sigma factor n=1 Tax=Flavobacterium alkalisoli TaxID=2602769 RepID=A0A5B9G0D9_9FLAO|nr:sensor of ECF-type sigma factor [Flavobacterium alkalisoli]QEE50527.1 sensor of ECF-type sigma factor [Flavobacterium alkalisoli]